MIQAGATVKCKADVWFNAYGDENRAVTALDPPRMVIERKRVGTLNFIRFEDVPDCWYWDDGFEIIDRRGLN